MGHEGRKRQRCGEGHPNRKGERAKEEREKAGFRPLAAATRDDITGG